MKIDSPVRVNSSLEYGLNIQRGLVSGISSIHTFGRNPLINTADGFEAIWDKGGSYTGFDPVVEENVTIVSSSALDTLLGTGAQIIRLSGLDSKFNEIQEDIALNGVTSVVSINKYFRVHIARVVKAGATGENQGIIDIAQQTTVANVFAEIEMGSNRSLNANYTVPFGKIAYIKQGFATLSKKQNALCEIRAKVRLLGSTFQIVEWFSIDGQASSYVSRVFSIPLIGVPAGTDILIEANTDTNNIAVAAGLEMFLVDE